MASIEYDLGYISEGLSSLERYLLSDDLYWNLRAASPPGEPAYPLFSLGGILLAQAKLEARQLSIEQFSKFSQLETGIERNRTHWRAAWTKKAEKEFTARLRLWRNFIEEYRQNPESNIDRYTYEVSRRVMLHFLREETDQISLPEQEMLTGLDKILSAVLIPGKFIWDDELQNGFPPYIFPYLYGTLKV